MNIFFAAERSFLPTLFVAGLFVSLVLVFFLLDLRDGVSVEGVFAGDDASASFAGDGVVFVFFFWEDALVGDGRFLELDSDGLCCFNGVVFRESNARDGDVGMVIRDGEMTNAFSSLLPLLLLLLSPFSTFSFPSSSFSPSFACFSFSCLATASRSVFSNVTYSSHFSAFGNCSIINRTECNEYPKNSGPDMAVFFATSPFCSRMVLARCKTSPQHAVADFFSMTIEPSSVVNENNGVFSVSSILISCVQVHLSSKFSGFNLEYNFVVLKPSGKM